MVISTEKMRRMNNLVTLFTAMAAFFFGTFLTKSLMEADIHDKCVGHFGGTGALERHPQYFLYILILSAPQNMERRRVMRDTWLRLGQPLMLPYYPEDFVYVPQYDERGHLKTETVSEQASRMRVYWDWLDGAGSKPIDHERNIKVKHFFSVGLGGATPSFRATIKDEAKKYGDMILLPKLHETYENLTVKMLHSIDIITKLYGDFSYLLKVDDDTYVKLDYLLNELVSYDRKLLRKTKEYHKNPLPQLYWGFFNGRANIKTKGQWSETNYFLANRYITYALGGGYVLSSKLCNYIANQSDILSTYVSEDISMGTWLAPLRNVYRRHDIRFDTGYMPRKCKKHHLVLHKRNDTMMNSLLSGKLCNFESVNEQKLQRPAEYYYDWKKSADNCCDSIAL